MACSQRGFGPGGRTQTTDRNSTMMRRVALPQRQGLFTAHELNWSLLTCHKSTQLHNAFIGHARQLRERIGCSETRSVGDHLVVNTMRPFTLGFRELEFSSFQVL